MDVIDNGNLVGSINGTVTGVTGLVTGRKGLALYTNGIDQYVNFGYQGDTCLGYFILCSHGWVSAFWVLPAKDRYGIIMDTGVFASRGMRAATHSNSMSIHVRFQSGSMMWKVFGKLKLAQGWIHVVVTWCLTHGAKLYIDGELLKADNCPRNKSTPFTDAQRFVLGASCMYDKMFGGALDELRVWDTVMSDEEALALYREDAGLSKK